MSKPFSLPDALGPYLDALNTQPDANQQELIDTAASMRSGGMKLSHEAAVFLAILVGAMRPRFVVEVGTFIGYSSLAIARALPPGGRLLCCDVSDEWTQVARKAWDEAGVGDRVELRLGPAGDTLDELATGEGAEQIDLAFVDADKGGYGGYYEQILARLSPHGVMAFDNTLWSGQVIDSSDTSPDTVALRAFNEMVGADDRTVNVTLPLGDGITLVSHSES